MIDRSQLLGLAVAALEISSPGRILAGLRGAGLDSLVRLGDGLPNETRSRVDQVTRAVDERMVRVLVYGEDDYPQALANVASPPPLLFGVGNFGLLGLPAVGMCGARNASDAGMNAARACAEAVAREGLVVVSGYAKGVDMEAHQAALQSGGNTIVVLAEGILRARLGRAADRDKDHVDQLLFLSQFPPRQPWMVGSAMARNEVIAGLGKALVVIEAGETGGTLNAGLRGLALGRPVLALEFESGPTPLGNRILHEKGAFAVRRPSELTAVLAALGGEAQATAGQLELLLHG